MSYVGAKPYLIKDGGTGQITLPTDGQLLIGNTATSGFNVANLTSGSGISITNGNGSIQIASTVAPPVLTPVFVARLSSTQSAVTGDGTDYSPIIFDALDGNVGLAYDNTTGIFTAPATQEYVFTFGITPQNIDASHTIMNFRLETSTGRIAYGFYGNPYASAYAGSLMISQTVVISMAANETAQISLLIDNGTKTIDVYGDNSGNYNTWFSGYLLAGNSGSTSNIDAVVDGSGNTVVPTGGLITLVNGTSVSSLSNSASHITFDVSGTTQYAVQVGNASGSLSSLPIGNVNKPLISGGAGTNPSFATLSVSGGGQGNVTLTAHSVLLGEGTSPIGSVGPGALDLPLIGQGAADPIFSVLNPNGGGTGSSGAITGVVTAHGASAYTASAVTQHYVMVGGASSAITSVSPSTAGFVLTSNGVGVDPSFQAIGGSSTLSTLTDGSGNVVSPTANNITLVDGNNISSLSGSASHITLNLTGTTTHALQVGNASGSLTSLGLGSSGQPLLSGGAGSDPSYGTLSVSNGGTSLTTLTTHAVLLGQGTSAIGFAVPSTANLPLISNGASSDPVFSTLLPAGGGTGLNTITAHAVMVGNGTSAVTPVGPGTAGLALVSNGALSDPSYQVLPPSGGGTGTTGSLTGIITGNGSSSMTASAVTQYTTLVADASNLVVGVGPGTAGYVLTSNGAGANPSYQSISGTFAWTDATSATYTIVKNNVYVTDRGGGVTYTLPASASLGDMFKIVGKLGIATITPNANQQLLIGLLSGTVGVTGTAVSTNVGDCITFACITAGASSVWRAIDEFGNWTLN